MCETPDFDKQMNMTQGEKAIERLRNRASFMAEDYRQDLDIVEEDIKKTKVYDTIVSKGVNVGNFKAMLEDWKDLTFENYIHYRIENSYELQSDYDFETKPLNEQEFNLVKESILCHW